MIIIFYVCNIIYKFNFLKFSQAHMHMVYLKVPHNIFDLTNTKQPKINFIMKFYIVEFRKLSHHI